MRYVKWRVPSPLKEELFRTTSILRILPFSISFGGSSIDSDVVLDDADGRSIPVCDIVITY